MSESVRVCVRLRPFGEGEEEGAVELTKLEPGLEHRCVKADGKGNTVSLVSGRGYLNRKAKFNYDAVFDETSTQEQLHESCGKPLVQSAFAGLNGTIFAYGQTGSGKTHTMSGSQTAPGIIPFVFGNIFDVIKERSMPTIDATGQTTIPPAETYQVMVSYYEIYREDVYDLLRQDFPIKGKVREDTEKQRFYIENLTSIPVFSKADCQKIFDQGSAMRRTASTKMNERSSRSHSIFHVMILKTSNGVTTCGQLNLCDLAGSERYDLTATVADRHKESRAINSSLSTLGLVIEALIKGRDHVPYRDSKLTQLLSESLGGNSRTIMLAMVGPSVANYSETHSTLMYAERVKKIRNKPTTNVEMDASTRYQMIIQQLQDEIKELQDTNRELVDAVGKSETISLDRLQHFKTTIDTLTEEKTKLELELKTVKAGTKKLFKELNAANQTLQGKLNESEAQRNEAVKKAEDLNFLLSQAHASKDDAIGAAEQILAAGRQEQTALQAEREQMMAEAEKTNALLAQITEKTGILEREMKAQEAMLETTRVERDEARKRESKKRKQTKRIIEAYEKQLEIWKVHMENKEKELQELMRMLEDERDSRVKSDTELNSVRESLVEATNSLLAANSSQNEQSAAVNAALTEAARRAAIVRVDIGTTTADLPSPASRSRKLDDSLDGSERKVEQERRPNYAVSHSHNDTHSKDHVDTRDFTHSTPNVGITSQDIYDLDSAYANGEINDVQYNAAERVNELFNKSLKVQEFKFEKKKKPGDLSASPDSSASSTGHNTAHNSPPLPATAGDGNSIMSLEMSEMGKSGVMAASSTKHHQVMTLSQEGAAGSGDSGTANVSMIPQGTGYAIRMSTEIVVLRELDMEVLTGTNAATSSSHAIKILQRELEWLVEDYGVWTSELRSALQAHKKHREKIKSRLLSELALEMERVEMATMAKMEQIVSLLANTIAKRAKQLQPASLHAGDTLTPSTLDRQASYASTVPPELSPLSSPYSPSAASSLSSLTSPLSVPPLPTPSPTADPVDRTTPKPRRASAYVAYTPPVGTAPTVPAMSNSSALPVGAPLPDSLVATTVTTTTTTTTSTTSIQIPPPLPPLPTKPLSITAASPPVPALPCLPSAGVDSDDDEVTRVDSEVILQSDLQLCYVSTKTSSTGSTKKMMPIAP